MIISGWIGHWLFANLFNDELLVIRVATSAFCMSICYFILLLPLGLLKKDDLRHIPLIGKPLSKLTFR